MQSSYLWRRFGAFDSKPSFLQQGVVHVSENTYTQNPRSEVTASICNR